MEMDALRGEPLNESEMALCRKGLNIPAIKEYNARTRVGLRASMDAVNAWGEANGCREDGPCGQCNGTGRARLWRYRS